MCLHWISAAPAGVEGVEETEGSERVRREREKEKIQEIVGASVRSCVRAPGCRPKNGTVGGGAVCGERGEAGDLRTMRVWPDRS